MENYDTNYISRGDSLGCFESEKLLTLRRVKSEPTFRDMKVLDKETFGNYF